jgi:hypothetical protein
MTFEQAKEMITFLRENGAIQVSVGDVSATFVEVEPRNRIIELKPEHDPDAMRITSEEQAFDDHIKKRFGFSTQEIMGG